jgi:hypothetical protein
MCVGVQGDLAVTAGRKKEKKTKEKKMRYHM